MAQSKPRNSLERLETAAKHLTTVVQAVCVGRQDVTSLDGASPRIRTTYRHCVEAVALPSLAQLFPEPDSDAAVAIALRDVDRSKNVRATESPRRKRGPLRQVPSRATATCWPVDSVFHPMIASCRRPVLSARRASFDKQKSPCKDLVGGFDDSSSSSKTISSKQRGHNAGLPQVQTLAKAEIAMISPILHTPESHPRRGKTLRLWPGDEVGNPVAGRAYWVKRDDINKPVVILPFGSFEPAGIRGNFAETWLPRRLPSCFKKRLWTEKGLLRWEGGQERQYAAAHLNEEDGTFRYIWVTSKQLRELGIGGDVEEQHIRIINFLRERASEIRKNLLEKFPAYHANATKRRRITNVDRTWPLPIPSLFPETASKNLKSSIEDHEVSEKGSRDVSDPDTGHRGTTATADADASDPKRRRVMLKHHDTQDIQSNSETPQCAIVRSNATELDQECLRGNDSMVSHRDKMSINTLCGTSLEPKAR